MWICGKCLKVIDPINVTFNEECEFCGEELTTLEEINSLLETKLSFHDLNETANQIWTAKKCDDKENRDNYLQNALNDINKILKLYELSALAKAETNEIVKEKKGRDFSVGDYCTVFDGNRWMKTGDIGNNESFWVKALITGFRKTEHNELLVDVVFDNGRESKGHYIEGVL